MKPLRNACAVLACASLLLGQFGCSTTKTLLSSTKYSESAYNTDKEIKAQSLALIDRAKDKAPYTGVAADVDQLMKKVAAAIAAEQARTKNLPTVEQWKKVKSQLSDLFGLWKTKGSLSPAFVDDAKTQVASLFDILIWLGTVVFVFVEAQLLELPLRFLDDAPALRHLRRVVGHPHLIVEQLAAHRAEELLHLGYGFSWNDDARHAAGT